MKLPIYQIDAFAESLFKGNPAAVCPLDTWLEDSLMQKIAAENNLAETAFVVKEGEKYQIRWFTPETEVALCGHATLASAYMIFEYMDPSANTLSFHSHKSGTLVVEKGEENTLTLDFPADPPAEVSDYEALGEALGKRPAKTLKGKTDYLLIYHRQRDIEKLNPNFYLLKKVEARGVIVTAPGDGVDFVSRFFAPSAGIDEDPVTGSAHTTLIPYWANRLKKNKLNARQLSKRGGALSCELVGDRVRISGSAHTYMVGEIRL